MTMTKPEAIHEACSIIALAVHSIGDYDHASDGFCDVCDMAHDNYRNEGHGLEYVRRAVLEKLEREHITVARGFDPETGREVHR